MRYLRSIKEPSTPTKKTLTVWGKTMAFEGELATTAGARRCLSQRYLALVPCLAHTLPSLAVRSMAISVVDCDELDGDESSSLPMGEPPRTLVCRTNVIGIIANRVLRRGRLCTNHLLPRHSAKSPSMVMQKMEKG